MHRAHVQCLVLVLLTAMCAGCAGALTAVDNDVAKGASSPSASRAPESGLSAMRAEKKSASDETPEVDLAVHADGDPIADEIQPTRSRPGTKGSPPALDAIIAELGALETLDDETRERLVEDLSRTDPRLWQPLLRQLKASALASREKARDRKPLPSANQLAQHEVEADEEPLPRMQRRASSRRTANTTATADDSAVENRPGDTIRDNGKQGQSIGDEKPPRWPRAPKQIEETWQVNIGERDQPLHSGDPPAKSAEARPMVPQQAESSDWRKALESAITALEKELEAEGDEADEERLGRLRLLLLAADRRDDAMRPLTNATTAQQGYWSNQVLGLATYLDRRRQPDLDRRAAEAASHLGAAATSLGEQGLLVVRNLAFCTEVKSFGVYNRVNEPEFRPGQKVFLYWEVDNFKSESTPKGHHTALKSHYQIFDPQGRKIDEGEFPLAEEWCQNRRRDFFICYYLWIPERVYDGRYTLQLTTTDQQNGKIGQSSIEFSVVDK